MKAKTIIKIFRVVLAFKKKKSYKNTCLVIMHVQYMMRRFSKKKKNYFVSTASFVVYQWMQINLLGQKFYKMTFFIKKISKEAHFAQNFRTNYMPRHEKLIKNTNRYHALFLK